MNTVGLLLPTHEPARMVKQFLPTVGHLTSLRDRATWLVLFQDPWTGATLRPVVTELEVRSGIPVKWDRTPAWPRPVSFAGLRHRCATLAPESDVFLLLDDDMRFSPGTPKYPRPSGHRYVEALNYIGRFPRCGGVMCVGFRGGNPYGYKIKPVWHALFSTRQGFLLRNMRRHGFLLYPPDVVPLRGALEEFIAACTRIEGGYYIAQQMNNPTIHRATRMEADAAKAEYDLDDPRLETLRYIRQRYQQPAWRPAQRQLKPWEPWKTPVSREWYTRQGGPDLDDPGLVVDYGGEGGGGAMTEKKSGTQEEQERRRGMDAPDAPKTWPKAKQTKQQLLEQHRTQQAAREAAAAAGGMTIVLQVWANGACALFVPRSRNTQMARPADWFGAMDEVKQMVVGSGWVRVRWRGGWAFPAEWQVDPAMLDAAISGALTKRGYTVTVVREAGVGEPPAVQDLR